MVKELILSQSWALVVALRAFPVAAKIIQSNMSLPVDFGPECMVTVCTDILFLEISGQSSQRSAYKTCQACSLMRVLGLPLWYKNESVSNKFFQPFSGSLVRYFC
jgi:hypothetical protein